MDYKKSYLNIFNAITDSNKHINLAKQILENVQIKAEEMYIDAKENDLKILKQKDTSD